MNIGVKLKANGDEIGDAVNVDDRDEEIGQHNTAEIRERASNLGDVVVGIEDGDQTEETDREKIDTGE